MGTYVTLAITDLAPRLWLLGDDPIEIRVEADPGKFLAHLPFRWAQFDYVFRQAPDELGRPPDLCHHRQRWARDRGGVDAHRTILRVSIEGRDEERTVQLNQFRLLIHARRRPLAGTHAACPVGGAQPAIRKFAIDLDKRAACFTNKDGACQRRVRPFTLSKGEVELFDITATTERCDCDWTVEMDYTVGDDERTQRITDQGGRPFRTTATSRAETFSHVDNRWYRGEHLAPPRR